MPNARKDSPSKRSYAQGLHNASAAESASTPGLVLGVAVCGPIVQGGINEVRQMLLEAHKPIMAEQIQDKLNLSHERCYEMLARLDAMGQADMMRVGHRMGWVAK